MSGAVIAQLLITFGPPALKWIEELAAIWTKDMSPDEVKAFCDRANKSYDSYIAEAKAKLIPVTDE